MRRAPSSSREAAPAHPGVVMPREGTGRGRCGAPGAHTATGRRDRSGRASRAGWATGTARHGRCPADRPQPGQGWNGRGAGDGLSASQECAGAWRYLGDASWTGARSEWRSTWSPTRRAPISGGMAAPTSTGAVDRSRGREPHPDRAVRRHPPTDMGCRLPGGTGTPTGQPTVTAGLDGVAVRRGVRRSTRTRLRRGSARAAVRRSR